MGARVEWELFCSPQKGWSASSYSWHLAMHAKQNFVFFTLYIRLMQFFLFFFIFFDKLSYIYFGFQLFLRSKTFFTRRMSDKRPPFRPPYLDLHTLRKGDLKNKMEHWSKNLFWFNGLFTSLHCIRQQESQNITNSFAAFEPCCLPFWNFFFSSS